MYLSKTTKRNIILMIVFFLVAGGIAAFLILQKPKIQSVSITGTGYAGSSLNTSILPMDATVSYQWKVSDSANGTFTDVPGATNSTLSLTLNDEGKYFMVTVKGTDKYAGKVNSIVFGPIRGIAVTWPVTTPIIYGQSIAESSLGEGSAILNGVQVPGTFSFDDTTVIPDKAGIYKANVTFTPSDLTHYKVVKAQADVLVQKAVLTVTVADKAVVYGDSIPTYAYTITGFVMGDDLTSVSGTPAITSLYTADLAVSYSPIQIIAEIGTLTSSNYDFGYVFGKLTISKRVLTISGISGNNKYYDGTTYATASGKAVLNNVVNGDNVYVTGTPNFTFAQKLAGDNIRITVKGYRLSGTKAANYILVLPTLYADILPFVAP